VAVKVVIFTLFLKRFIFALLLPITSLAASYAAENSALPLGNNFIYQNRLIYVSLRVLETMERKVALASIIIRFR
jgi:hypothetical protein